MIPVPVPGYQNPNYVPYTPSTTTGNLNPSVPASTVAVGYFGNLSPNVSDDIFIAIFSVFSSFQKFKRPVDPSTGKAKPFALVEFESKAGLTRVFKLLQDFPMDGRNFNIKVEDQEEDHKDRELSNENKKLELEAEISALESISKILIGKKMTQSETMLWLEKKAALLRKDLKKTVDNLSKVVVGAAAVENYGGRDLNRNYEDLLFDTTVSSVGEGKRGTGPAGGVKQSVTNSVKSSDLTSSSLKDRERRWESTVRSIEKDLKRDIERDRERDLRHAKEAKALADQLGTFKDDNNLVETNTQQKVSITGDLSRNINFSSSDSSLFFKNRTKWREQRSCALAKEHEIFKDFLEFKPAAVIPEDTNRLFAYPIRWKKFDKIAFKTLFMERIDNFYPNSREFNEKICEFLVENAGNGNMRPERLIENLQAEPCYLAVQVTGETEEAEFLVVLMWRWLIYHTEQ